MALSTLVCVIGGYFLIGATLWYFWNRLYEFLNTVVRDIIEKVFGTVWANRFADLVIWLDNTVSRAKRIVKNTAASLYRWFTGNVLKIETTYRDIRGTNPMQETIVIVGLPDGSGRQTTIRKPVSCDEMSDDVRAKAIREGATTVVVNEMDVVGQQYKKRLKISH